jgi:hypothetical protein
MMATVQLLDDNMSPTVLGLMNESDARSDVRPVLACASDVRELVQYLRLKPDGVVAAEELDRSKRRLFDERKLAAYDSLGITTRHDGVVRLSARGRRFARNFEFDAQAFRSMLSQSISCWSALQWISEQNYDLITSPEVITYWLKVHPETFGVFDDEYLKSTVVSFFSFCQGAGLGTMTLGKRGHITRFCVDRIELKRFVNGDALAIPDEPAITGSKSSAPLHPSSEARFKVLIHSHDDEIARVLQETFQLIGLNSDKIELCWGNLASHISSLTEECALVVVMGEDCFNGNSRRSVEEEVLVGLGAAQVLFDGRLIVLAEKNDLLVEKLKNLRCIEYEATQLSWSAGLEIARVMKCLDCKRGKTKS